MYYGGGGKDEVITHGERRKKKKRPVGGGGVDASAEYTPARCTKIRGKKECAVVIEGRGKQKAKQEKKRLVVRRGPVVAWLSIKPRVKIRCLQPS